MSPQFFDDEDLLRCSQAARLTFEGLWCLADREGRLMDRPEMLKLKLLPFDDVDMDAVLEELAAPRRGSPGSFIIRYEVDGRRYIQVVNFHKHQNPHRNEVDSTIPAPNSRNVASDSLQGASDSRQGSIDSGLILDPDPDPRSGGGEGSGDNTPPEETDPSELTDELCAECNYWLETKLKPSEPMRQIVANLLLTGSTRGGVESGNGGIRAEDIADAVHGYIVREKTDDYHARRRREKSPVPLLWVLRSLDRLAEYAEIGRNHFEAWATAERARRDRTAQREEYRH